MKPSEIRNVLEDHEVRPSKSLGQNFLTDENVARWIVEQLEIRPQDCVVEVGPGTGSLTEHAAPLCRKLVLVEFDSRLAEYQKERWAGDPHVEVHHADGASWDPRGLFAEAPVKFLGNLPYSAGGAILQNFLSRPSAVERAVVMLQKEFIDRILATPDDDAFGLLSLRIQKNWIPRALKTIPPEAFHPRPRIDSTVMLLTPRPARELPPYDDRLMDELMRKAFSQRRKQLKKQLPASPPWEGVAASLGLSPSARAEELNLSQWVELARVYDTNPLKDVAQSGDELFDIVDELNQVTGQGTRREIHEGSLRHRAVHMFLVNKHGAVLLQKRSLWKDRQPGKWDSSGSRHLDAGESYEEAAVRELKEELGCPAAGCRKSRILTPEKITAGNSSPSMKGGIPGRFVFRRRRWTACSGSRRSKSRRGWNAVRRISRLRSFPAGMHGWPRIEKIILTQIHIMINPDQLSPEQIQSIRTWAEEGLDLNAIQKRRMRT